MTEKKLLTLGLLNLKPINLNEIEAFKNGVKNTTLPKIKEDVKRMSRNVAVARERVAYTQSKI